MMDISPGFLRLVEQTFNRYLALDLEMSAQFAELDGKCLCFDISVPKLRVYCSPRVGTVTLQSDCKQNADCTIKGSTMALYRLIRREDTAQSLSSGEVEIQGDSRVAQRFSDILKSVEIDWEELSSKLVGDFAAHKVGNVARGFKGWLDEALAALQMDTSEYLREESGVLPTRVEIAAFMEQIDQFRSDVDRLEARVRRLERMRIESDDSR
jgi:ubiquinone biosynthesis protein UbiJ